MKPTLNRLHVNFQENVPNFVELNINLRVLLSEFVSEVIPESEVHLIAS